MMAGAGTQSGALENCFDFAFKGRVQCVYERILTLSMGQVILFNHICMSMVLHVTTKLLKITNFILIDNNLLLKL